MSYYSIASTTISINKLICRKSNQYLKTIISPSLYYYWTEIMLQCRKNPNWAQITMFFSSIWMVILQYTTTTSLFYQNRQYIYPRFL